MAAIDYSLLKQITAREIISALQRDGFVLINQRGSHKRFAHSDGRKVTISYHRSGQTIIVKTLKSIIEKQTKWSVDDLRRLKLI